MMTISATGVEPRALLTISGPPAVSCAVRVAAHHLGYPGAPLSVRHLQARMGARHLIGRRTESEDFPRRAAGALKGIACQHSSIARVAEGLGVSWNTANTAALAEGQRVLISSPTRFDGVNVIGIDEHV